ncbi:MAG: peptidylprolyl isomerase [Balneolaceae bacterium]
MKQLNRLTPILTLLLIVWIARPAVAQEYVVADQIVAQVNDRIILKSDVDQQVTQFLRGAEMQNQEVEFTEELWYAALESIIDNHAILEKARMDSIVVSDDQVERQMDMRIQQLVQQAGSERALEEAFGQSIIQIKAEFRNQFREQIIADQVQDRFIDSIMITRSEVEEFFNAIPEDELPVIPEMVAISQIVVEPPPLDDARNQAYQKALAIRDSVIQQGMNFEEMARRHSDGPSAPRGGALGMIPVGDLVANYSAAATALNPGEISGVVRTEFGYHIIRLNNRVGDNIDTDHILIEIDEQSLDEEYAINKLNAIRDSVLVHGKSFADLARAHSDDDDTRSMGGRVIDFRTQQRLLPLSQLDPAMYRVVLLLDEEGEISEPRPFTLRGPQNRQAYRIIRLDQHVPEHEANLSDDYERIRRFALEEKRARKFDEWLAGIRDILYIEYKIDIPDTGEDSLQLEQPETMTQGTE